MRSTSSVPTPGANGVSEPICSKLARASPFAYPTLWSATRPKIGRVD